MIASTNAPGLVLDGGDRVATRLATAAQGRQLLLVDLAVPRDLDPAIRELDGCYLYDIDDLEQIVAETLSGRRREAERAETIVAAEAEKFHEWHASLDVVPAIASLRARAEEIRDGRAAEGRIAARAARRQPAPGGRVGHGPDREQAPPPADGADEAGSRGSRWGRSMLRRCGTSSVSARTSAERQAAPARARFRSRCRRPSSGFGRAVVGCAPPVRRRLACARPRRQPRQ